MSERTASGDMRDARENRECPGLFHSVPLRPYYEHMPVIMDLLFTHVMVGAQWNGVE
jgi:hypothetical protein